MLRCLVICVALVPFLASGQDPTVVNAPHIEVGDCWTYRAKGIFRKGWVESYRECVVHIDNEKNLIQAIAVLQPGGQEVDTLYSLTWGEGAVVEGYVRHPPAEWFQFPLHVGDSYHSTWQFRDAAMGGMGYTDGTGKVIGWETITVLAGTFRTLRIEFYAMPSPGFPFTNTFWYAPAVHRLVKAIYQPGNINYREIELIKAELIP
jgi:hypothetical protein